MTARAADIHSRLGATWPVVLAQLGIPETFLRPKKPGPCLLCGGRDRWVFDNRHGRGDYFCRQCGAGDGFTLLQRAYGWTFAEARKRVIEAAGLATVQLVRTPPPPPEAPTPARPSARVLDILRGACDPGDVADVREYLASRRLWPLPPDCTLRGHASVEYWEERRRIGRYPALVAPVRDVAGALVTAHITYLASGRKLTDHEPRKILSPLTGRSGCAVRLMPIAGDTLAVGEGVETSLAAHKLQGIPVWAALNTSLLAKFEPPPDIRSLIILADSDVPGLEAAARLVERMGSRLRVELRVPPQPAKDWADVLMERSP